MCSNFTKQPKSNTHKFLLTQSKRFFRRMSQNTHSRMPRRKSAQSKWWLSEFSQNLLPTYAVVSAHNAWALTNLSFIGPQQHCQTCRAPAEAERKICCSLLALTRQLHHFCVLNVFLPGEILILYAALHVGECKIN